MIQVIVLMRRLRELGSYYTNPLALEHYRHWTAPPGSRHLFPVPSTICRRTDGTWYYSAPWPYHPYFTFDNYVLPYDGPAAVQRLKELLETVRTKKLAKLAEWGQKLAAIPSASAPLAARSPSAFATSGLCARSAPRKEA